MFSSLVIRQVHATGEECVIRLESANACQTGLEIGAILVLSGRIHSFAFNPAVKYLRAIVVHFALIV